MPSTQDISQNRKLLWLMAISCGLTAGANYFCQPLIHSIQHSFHTSTAQAQFTVTLAQISYAVGLLFIVPLGDITQKSKFIPLLMAFSGIGLLLSALSTNLYMLWFGTVLAGLFSVAAQVLIPFSTIMVQPNKIGETVGFLMSGLLIGILLSTSLAGILSNLLHWKVVYFFSAFLIFWCAYQLKKQLPQTKGTSLNYFDVFKSMKALITEEHRLSIRGLMGGFSFASMSILFATMAVYLSAPPFNLKDAFIGMISLVGIIGALSSQYVGKFADRGYTVQLTFIGSILLISSWLFLYLSQQHFIYYIIGFAVLNTGVAFTHSCNQSIIYKLRPNAKSRINAIYMTFYFGGAAFGSAMGIFAWNHGGWIWACITGLVFAILTTFFAVIDYLLVQKKYYKIS